MAYGIREKGENERKRAFAVNELKSYGNFYF